MVDWKKICKKLLFPPVWLMILLIAASAAGLAFVFVNGLDAHPIAYVIYMISFYTLCVVCIFGWKVLPGYYKSAKQKVYENKFGNRYMNDAAFRTQVSLYLSFGVNMLYVGLNTFSAISYHTAWFGILAGYYTILAVMRLVLLQYVRKSEIGTNMLREWKRARVCACILTLINISLSGAILMMMFQNRGFAYNGVLIYVMAAYTFYSTTHAIVNIVKYRKYNSPVMSAATVITFAAALVSMLSLETAMLTAFGTDTTPETKRILIASTGPESA